MPSKKLFLTSISLFVLVSLLFVGYVGASSEMWSQTYGGTGSDVAYALVETSDGGFAIAGGTQLVKTDEFGNMEWNKTYGEGSLCSLVETSDGGFAIAGGTESFDVGSDDFWLVKTDAYGNMEWNRTYGGESYEYAHSLIVTSDGGFALAGCTRSFGAGLEDFWLVKTDTYGNMEWNMTYGGEEWERAYELVVTSDGGYALAGYTRSFGAGLEDFWLVKTDEHGIPEFPSWIILPLLLTATFVAIICKQRLPKTPSN